MHSRINWIGEALAALYGHAANYRGFENPAGRVAFTGEPPADLNMGIIWQTEGVCELFDWINNGEPVPFLMILTHDSGIALAGHETDIACIDCGTAPLMEFSPSHGFSSIDSRSSDIRIAATPSDLTSATKLMASAFSLDEAMMRNALAEGLLYRSDVTVYLLIKGDEPVSTVIVTRHGKSAGIWCMATVPAEQRQGHGHKLLRQVIRAETARGIDSFFLLSTPSGLQLYKKVGFSIIEEMKLWLRGESNQAKS